MAGPRDQYIAPDQFELLQKAEKEAIEKHRDRNNRTDWNGLALSGGGIRSAIFCLGALQALAERNVLGKFDYMSSVSGGGYIASALQWFWRIDPSTGTSQNNFPFGTPENPGTKEKTDRLAYLRAHGQYLTPDKRISIWSMTAVVIRTLFLNLAVWLPVGAFILFAGMAGCRGLQGQFLKDWLPNFFSSIAPSKWKGDCTEPCRWSQEIFFGLFTVAGILIVAGFAIWALVFALDTRISPKQDADPKSAPRRAAYAGAAILCSVALYYFADRVVMRLGTLDAFTLWAAFVLAAGGAICAFLFVLQARGAEASANYSWRRRFERTAGAWLPWTTIIFAVGTIPLIPYLLLNNSSPFLKAAAGAVGALSGIISAVFGHNAQGQREAPSDLSRWVLMAASAVFLYTIAVFAYSIAYLLLDPGILFPDDSTRANKENITRALILLAIVIAFVMMLRTNVNYVGLHRFYRDRLMEAFMPEPRCVANNVLGKSPEADRLAMADLWPGVTAEANAAAAPPAAKQAKRSLPYPIVNTNAIMINDTERKIAWRGGDNFIISPLYTGCALTGWESTARHVLKNGPLTLPSAMAASGAALNANAAYAGAGVTRDRLLSIVLMLLNLRLGMWVARPSSDPKRWFNHEPNHFNPAFLYGMTRSGYKRKSRFVELSDGGHFDNLGIYELVRRRLSVIVAIDGEEDPSTAMPALYSAAQRVREDFGTVIDLDKRLDDLVPAQAEGYPGGAKFVKFPFFAASIKYSSGETGILIYIKLSLAPSIGFGARGYRAQNPDFPHQSTANQFFVPEQVEAYLEVGYVNAKTALNKLGLTANHIDPKSMMQCYENRNSDGDRTAAV